MERNSCLFKIKQDTVTRGFSPVLVINPLALVFKNMGKHAFPT